MMGGVLLLCDVVNASTLSRQMLSPKVMDNKSHDDIGGHDGLTMELKSGRTLNAVSGGSPNDVAF